jgi:hypothetical protein
MMRALMKVVYSILVSKYDKEAVNANKKKKEEVKKTAPSNKR